MTMVIFADIQVPGLNAPIPPGTQFGYHAGGWGKPPVNEDGEPLYGDVFGQFADEEDDEQVIITSSLTIVHYSLSSVLAGLCNPTGRNWQPCWQELTTTLADLVCYFDALSETLFTKPARHQMC